MSAGRPLYQFFEQHDPELHEALKADIVRRGQREPIQVDEQGNILVGHERARILAELGIEPDTVVVAGLSDEQKAEHAILSEVLRRHLGPIGRARAIAQLAEIRGATLGSGGGPAGDRPTVGRLAEELGTKRSTAYRILELARKLEGHPDLAAEVDAGRMEGRRAISLAQSREAKARPAPHREAMPDAIDVRLGDFREVLSAVADASADLILTDPPYDAAGMPLYRDLGALAARTLKPEAVLLAEAGGLYLPQAIAMLSEHLRYRWCIAMILPGQHANVYPAKAINGWRPLLAFTRHDHRPSRWLMDTLVVTERPDKALHPWQKSVQAASYYVEQLTEPGDLVVDPFLGSGTTAVACYRLGRRFVGAEMDRDAWHTARVRIADEAKGFE